MLLHNEVDNTWLNVTVTYFFIFSMFSLLVIVGIVVAVVLSL